MSTVSGSFTATGFSAILRTGNHKERITFGLSGTYVATVRVQRGVKGSVLAWDDLATFNTEDATESLVVDAEPNSVFRMICDVFTSGEAEYTFSDGDAVVRVFKDADNNDLYRQTQGAHEFLGDASVSGVHTRFALTPYTVATVPAVVVGQIIYVSNGAAGEPTLAVGEGSNWVVLGTGATVAAV
jgi:hypothetical protein